MRVRVENGMKTIPRRAVTTDKGGKAGTMIGYTDNKNITRQTTFTNQKQNNVNLTTLGLKKSKQRLQPYKHKACMGRSYPRS